jgi:predicted transcriptional regulator
MASTNVRISEACHETLRRLAREEGRSMQAVLDRAVERYRRAKFLRGANADFAALRKNSRAWKEEQAEREVWEQTSADGLEDE